MFINVQLQILVNNRSELRMSVMSTRHSQGFSERARHDFTPRKQLPKPNFVPMTFYSHYHDKHHVTWHFIYNMTATDNTALKLCCGWIGFFKKIRGIYKKLIKCIFSVIILSRSRFWIILLISHFQYIFISCGIISIVSLAFENGLAGARCSVGLIEPLRAFLKTIFHPCFCVYT